MRHVFAIFILLITAWVILPGAAQAHDMPHDAMAMADRQPNCPDCPVLDQTSHQRAAHDCHHGAGCATAIPMSLSSASFRIAAPEAQPNLNPDDFAMLRSIALGHDLPPPRI
ncbi:hypothetical protein [Pseudooceanicola sp. MF1-13]|uniref:hypothetical protein n=1 Tax=Pseudooceanicola sp. MF1-13 TaxID=3379095 RepID=UPI003891EF70